MNENNTPDYGWETTAGPGSCNYITPKILKILRELSPKRILDIGSGNGALCADLTNNGYEIVGMEYDTKGYQIAKKEHPSIKFYNYGVQNDPSELLKSERVFDVVVSTEVIEHLYSPHQLVQYAAKVLKEDGLLIISTPYNGYLKNLVLSLLDDWDHHLNPLWHGGHIKFWSRKTLTKLLAENKYEVIKFTGAGRAPYLWRSMILVARKKT